MTKDGVKDQIKDKKVSSPKVLYLNTANHNLLPNGDKACAIHQANYYSNQSQENKQPAELVTNFDADYSFADKILPVWKLNMSTSNNKDIMLKQHPVCCRKYQAMAMKQNIIVLHFCISMSF